MSEINHCPSCGAELRGGASDLPCPACLMKLALDGGWGDSETPTELYATGFKAPSVEQVGARLPQFEVIELVGRGGMGAVYKARQRSLDRVVAIKIINPDAAKQPGFAERFGREARAMARLNQANIVTIHDFGQAADPDAANDQPMYYLVMEYVDGTNLRSMLRQRRLEPGEAMEIVRSLCDALQYAHEEGIVHRDIKPENILIDKKGRVKIADFGLAKLVGRTPRDITLTDSHHALGTLHYMAPEQLERPLDVDHRADIYALGVTFYEMLTGELPIGRFAPPSRKAHIDVRLDEVVLRTLEREPERRYQHASDVKTAVQSCGAGPLRKPGDVPDTTVETSSALAPGTAPRLLMVTLGSIASLSMAIGGVGLLIYSTAIYATAGPERWSWFFGGGIGFSIGGIAGMLTCWNHFRTMRGKRDFMQDLRWNLWDTFLLTYGTTGASCLVAAFIWWNSFEFWPRNAALVVGGIMGLQGLGMSLWRWAFRRAVTAQPAQAALELQMVIIAISMLACGLLVVGGVVMSVYSATSLPGGSVRFWAGIASAVVWLFAGGGGLLATWNWYRSLEGESNWMTEAKTNILDRAMYAIAAIGTALVIGGFAASPWISTINMGAMAMVGGILLVPAAIAIFIRAMMRRAARQVAEQAVDS